MSKLSIGIIPFFFLMIITATLLIMTYIYIYFFFFLILLLLGIVRARFCRRCEINQN